MTLHLPPPLILTFSISFVEPSRIIILSTGGNPSGYKLAQNLGHTIVKPVPSLFTFSTKEPNLDECSGVSIKGIDIEIKLNNKNFQNRGDLLITHWGFSGPAILKVWRA